MHFEENIDWGTLSVGDVNDCCLTEELFEKFSLKAILHKNKTNEEIKQGDVGDKNGVAPALETKIPFQRVSDLSIEDQKFFIQTYKDYVAGKDIGFENIARLQNLVWLLKCEQEQFSNFLYQHSLLLKDEYNFVHTHVHDVVQKLLSQQRCRVQNFPQQYTLFQTVGLSSGAVFPNDPILRYVRTLQEAVGQPLLHLPSFGGRTKLSIDNSLKDFEIRIELLEDSAIYNLSVEHGVNFVLTDTALQTLIDNHLPDYEKEWELPVTVLEHSENPARTIVIGDPLPVKSVTPREMNVLYYKHNLCRLLTSSANEDVKNEIFKENCEPLVPVNRPGNGSSGEEKCPQYSLRKYSTPTQNISNNKPDNNITDPQNESKHRNRYTFSIWTFGDLKLLICSRHDGLLYRSKKGSKGCLRPASIFVKPEYQLMFGFEQITPSEASRMWISSYINLESLCICARVDPGTSELVRVDVLDQATLINLSSFNPAQPMKMIHCVLSSLSKLLETGKYLLSHSTNDMHMCIYEMKHGVDISHGGKKALFDLHEAHSRRTEILKLYEKILPWVPMDPNIFLQCHISQDRLPMTFPAVSHDELETLKTKEVKEKNQFGGKKKKTKKTKKNKKSKSNARKLTGFNKANGPNSRNVFDTNQKRRNSNRGIGSDKPLGAYNIFDSEIDPSAYDNSVGERLRSRSKPMTYDDIDLDF